MKKQPPAAIPLAPVSKPAWEGQPGDLPIVFFGRTGIESTFGIVGWGSAGSQSRLGVVWPAKLADKRVLE